jgi:hypothetical protein
MTAQMYTPWIDAPNDTRASADYRLWGSYSMPKAERVRQELLGIIAPKRTAAYGKTVQGTDTESRLVLAVHDLSNSGEYASETFVL